MPQKGNTCSSLPQTNLRTKNILVNVFSCFRTSVKFNEHSCAKSLGPATDHTCRMGSQRGIALLTRLVNVLKPRVRIVTRYSRTALEILMTSIVGQIHNGCNGSGHLEHCHYLDL
jgi:hypothetical protein